MHQVGNYHQMRLSVKVGIPDFRVYEHFSSKLYTGKMIIETVFQLNLAGY